MIIRSKETREVLNDVLRARKVPSAVYKFSGGKLPLMVGNRIVEFSTKAGLGFYALQDLVEKLRRAIDEYETAKNLRNQFDLEDLVRSKVAEAAE